MSTLYIRIDQTLYDQITAISKSNGVSISDSITAYLRAVVQTNSLSIHTQLSGAPITVPAPAVQLKKVEPKKCKADSFSQAPLTEEPTEQPKEPRTVEEPLVEQPSPGEQVESVPEESAPVEKKRLNRAVPIPELKGVLVERFITLICAIPDGLLSTWEDLEWAIGGTEGAVEKPLHDNWPRTAEIKGKQVAVPYWRVLSWAGSTKGEVTCNRDLREAMLVAEGHELVTTGRGMRVVRGYKKRLVEWVHP